jgi:hypothetical protein
MQHDETVSDWERAQRCHEFKKLCEAHDMTYEFSDDGRVWRRGAEEWSAIKAAAQGIPRADACRIWNATVDKRIAPGHRSPFYWPIAPKVAA